MDWVNVSAPGSLMLMGEHAVLHGHPALACAVDRRIYFELERRDDGRVCVESELGNLDVPADGFAVPGSMRFAGEAIKKYLPKLAGGVRAVIRAEFSSTIGLGSSAAVASGMVAGLRKLCGESCSPDELFEDAREVVLAVQGRGSCTDVAASVYGGVVLFRVEPRLIERMDADFPLLAVYCGYKEPTVKVIERVEQDRASVPGVYERLYEVLQVCVEGGADAVRCGDVSKLGRLMDVHHEIQCAMKLNTPELDEIVAAMRSMPGVFGAKISGSGLGDCALAVGEGEWTLDMYERIAISVDRHGVLFDE